MTESIEVREYVTAAGKFPVRDYLRRLHDPQAQTRITMRVNRLATGNFGDSKFVRDGVFELRIDYGPGYRVYFGVLESRCVLLLCARDKRTQLSDIGLAVKFLRDYKVRSSSTVKRKPSVSHDEVVIRELRRDPDFAAEYLRAALEDEDDPRVILIALRHVARARGIAKVAKAAGIERESLYRALSAKGNPRLTTLLAVLKAMGVKLTVEAA